jgi:hypothetical protein
VRLVVYRIDGRAMTPILNEKVMAGLGRDGRAQARFPRMASSKRCARFAVSRH